MSHRVGLLLVLIAYLGLTLTYSVIVPIGRGADEWAHYWYVQFIADHGRLPVTIEERTEAGYKSDWPPLYHFIVAALISPIETDGPPHIKYRADNFRRALAPPLGSEANLFTEDELFSWQQAFLVWHIGRFASILFSLGTLWVTYRLASYILGEGWLAVLPVLLLAFNPRYLFTGMLLNYDSLTLLLSALFLLSIIRVVHNYPRPIPLYQTITISTLAGLALVTKYLTAPLLFVWLGVLLYYTVKLHDARSYASVRKWIASVLVAYIKKSALWQSLLVYTAIVGVWFGYLIRYFNEIEQYGLGLGLLAPLLRGDGSDRTIERLFAWLSGGQAPPPVPIPPNTTPWWQVLSEFPLTFWGNPIVRPYPLNWFVALMTVIVLVALLGLMTRWRNQPTERLMINLLVIYSLLPTPFMAIRLFGARNVLEAVQGRHILFLAGPAVVILLAMGLDSFVRAYGRVPLLSRVRAPARERMAALILILFLLSGAIGQAMFMSETYGAPLPMRTTAFAEDITSPLETVSLPGGATWQGFRVAKEEQMLRVSLFWQGGTTYETVDYHTELTLVDETGQTVSQWRAYQAQGRYPTRLWEAEDWVRDDGWLPLMGLSAGEYQIRWQVWAEDEPFFEPIILATWRVNSPSNEPDLTLWQDGQSATWRIPTFRERETIQFSCVPADCPNQLYGPDGLAYTAETGRIFIVQPHWPAGEYRLSETGEVWLHIAENKRVFDLPTPTHPVQANFADQLTLLGYDLPTRQAQPGGGLPLTLFWQGQRWLGEDLVIFARLLDVDQTVWGARDRRPQENYSTLLIAPREVVADSFALPIAPTAPDGIYSVRVGLYRPDDGAGESLPLVDNQTGELTEQTAITIGPFKVGQTPAEFLAGSAQPENSLSQPFGEPTALTLYGYTLNSIDNALRLTLFWQVEQPLSVNYTTFVHLKNEAGEVIAQQDQPPLQGRYPTQLWSAGEQIADEIVIPAPDQPIHQISLGLYDPQTGQRLMVQGQPDGAFGVAVGE